MGAGGGGGGGSRMFKPSYGGVGSQRLGMGSSRPTPRPSGSFFGPSGKGSGPKGYGRVSKPAPRYSPGRGFWQIAQQWFLDQFKDEYEQPWANQGGSQVAPGIAGFSLERQCTVLQSGVCGFVSGYWTSPGPDPSYPRCDVCIPALPQNQNMQTIATPLAVGDWLLQDGLAAAGQNGPYRWYKRRNGTAPVFLPGYAKPLPYSPAEDDTQPDLLPWVDPHGSAKPGGSTKIGVTNKPEAYAPPYVVADPGRGHDVVITPPGGGTPVVEFRPPPHRPGRPPVHRHVPDKKPKISMPPWLFGLMRIYHGGTEIMEAFDCMFDALPADVKGDHIKGSEFGHAKWTGIDKIQRTLENLGSVDWGQAVGCMAYNNLIEDKAVGAFMRKLGSNFAGAGGPSTTQVGQFGRQMKGLR